MLHVRHRLPSVRGVVADHVREGRGSLREGQWGGRHDGAQWGVGTVCHSLAGIVRGSESEGLERNIENSFYFYHLISTDINIRYPSSKTSEPLVRDAYNLLRL